MARRDHTSQARTRIRLRSTGQWCAGRSRGSRLDADDRLDAYNERRPALDVYRRHRPFHGGGHLLAHGDWAVFMPQTGWALSLDDFLVTRLVERAVHMEDLAVGVGISVPQLPGAASIPWSRC
ncbi:hypothetical protein [Streptomyces sp. NPDC013455]|uniref:hypothetical protein n=1 Tax=Streptomyces sp. NPDC013455 TaxID=3155605 RepID=UPI0033E9FF3B